MVNLGSKGPKQPNKGKGNKTAIGLSESVKCRFSKRRFGVELKKLEKILKAVGSIEKLIQKALLGLQFHFAALQEGAALVKADFFFAGAPAIENKTEQNSKH